MSNNHEVDTDVLLERRLGEFRDEAIPEGPSPTVIKTTVGILHEAEMAKGNRAQLQVTVRWSFIERLVEMTFASKLAAAVMITLGGIIIFFMFSLFSSLGSSVAFADVVQKIKAAHTLTYMNTVTLAPLKTSQTFKTLIKDPDRMRMEMPGGVVSINVGRTILILNPASHSATKWVTTSPPGTTQPTALKNLADMFGIPDKDSGVAVGDKEINGVIVTGFRVIKQPQMTMTMWANKKSGQLIEVDSTMAGEKGNSIVVMDHFEIDSVLDDSLFSLDAPAGYTLTSKTQEDLPISTASIEDTVADLLHGYADVSGGKFPVSLTEWFPLLEAAKRDTTGRLTAAKIGSLTGRLFSVPGWGYQGEGAKLGERDKVVFWYRPDPKAGRYRALFADMHVSDITADQLPTTKPSHP